MSFEIELATIGRWTDIAIQWYTSTPWPFHLILTVIALFFMYYIIRSCY